GLLNRVPGSRGLLPTQPAGLCALGTLAAGDPLDLFDPGAHELLELGEWAHAITRVPPGPPSTAQKVYALRVRGSSMIEAGILDGDYVLIAPGPVVANGAIAVVLQQQAHGDRGAATLKRVFRTGDGVCLQPANEALAPRFIGCKEWDREWQVQ